MDLEYDDDDGEDVMMDEVDTEEVSAAAAGMLAEDSGMMSSAPSFPAISATAGSVVIQERSVRVPPNRFTPLRNDWPRICPPLVEHMQLSVRMNTATKHVQLRTTERSTDTGNIQKAEDFLKAYMLGFAVEDAIALLRLDDLYVESFRVEDVKTLKGDNLSRAIGRISGKDGRTKFTIEKTTRTRIVLADRNIHILGSFQNIKIARDAICDLIMGSPANKVYARLRSISARMGERF